MIEILTSPALWYSLIAVIAWSTIAAVLVQIAWPLVSHFIGEFTTAALIGILVVSISIGFLATFGSIRGIVVPLGTPAAAPSISERDRELLAREELRRTEELRGMEERLRRGEREVFALREFAMMRAIPAFPWPPPVASAQEILPLPESLPRALGDYWIILSRALDMVGYVEKSHYRVPGGFALVTRLEQIEPDGAPKRPPARWSIEPTRLTVFSLFEYLRALFTANPGYYRVIVFILTDVPFNQRDASITADEVAIWLRGGLNVLPDEIALQKWRPGVRCTALIYEFEREQDKPPVILLPSRLNGSTHIAKSGIMDALLPYLSSRPE